MALILAIWADAAKATRTGLGRLIPLAGAAFAAAGSAALIDGLMAAAEKYYVSAYVVLEDEELANAARTREPDEPTSADDKY